MNKMFKWLMVMGTVSEWLMQAAADGVITADEIKEGVELICKTFDIKAEIQIPTNDVQ